jgi:hypothetical protein
MGPGLQHRHVVAGKYAQPFLKRLATVFEVDNPIDVIDQNPSKTLSQQVVMVSIRMGDDERVNLALLFVGSGENIVPDCIFFSSRYRAGVNQDTSSVRANEEHCVTLTHVNEMNL